jgi:hypothetical protein
MPSRHERVATDTNTSQRLRHGYPARPDWLTVSPWRAPRAAVL